MKKLLLVLALVSVGSVMAFIGSKPLPSGPYRATCKQCYVSDDHVLLCVCKNRRDETKNTFLQLPEGYERTVTVGNVNGELRQLLK